MDVGKVISVLVAAAGIALGEVRARRAERRAQQDSENLERLVVLLQRHGGVVARDKFGRPAAVSFKVKTKLHARGRDVPADEE